MAKRKASKKNKFMEILKSENFKIVFCVSIAVIAIIVIILCVNGNSSTIPTRFGDVKYKNEKYREF